MSETNEEQVSSAVAAAHDSGEQMEQYVVFRLENEEYAAPILDVQEIIPTGDITPFPNVPDYIVGIINVRGTVATVINLAKRFSLVRSEAPVAAEENTGEAVEADKYIILTMTEKALYGIQVDSVSSVIKISKDDIRPASGATNVRISADLVHGLAVVDERIILILDFKKILDDEQAASIAPLASAVSNAASASSANSGAPVAPTATPSTPSAE